jgi:hypothetical protein
MSVKEILERYKERVRKARIEGRCWQCGNVILHEGLSLAFEPSDGYGPEGVCQLCGEEAVEALEETEREAWEEERLEEEWKRIKASKVIRAFLLRLMEEEEGGNPF